MSAVKHTETPWFVAVNDGGPLSLVRAGNMATGRRIADTFAGQPSAKTREGYIASLKENEANAAFIVRACNAYDNLVNTLKAIRAAEPDGIAHIDIDAELAKAGAE